MKHWAIRSFQLFYDAAYNLVHNDGVELAGYLTFCAVLAVFPFLVLLVAAAGFFGQGASGNEFITLMMHHLPHDAVAALRPRIDEITSGPPPGLLTISILGAIWTASSAVEGMRAVLNRAYQVSEPPHYVLRRIISILQVLLFTLLVICVMTVRVLAPVVFEALQQHTSISIPPQVTEFFVEDFIFIGAGILFLAVSSLYFWLPNIKQRLLSVMPGALLVVILWMAGATVVTLYLHKISQLNVIYGSLSSFIAMLIFFFVMNLIFIYGAEFNHQLLVLLGKRIVEKEHGAGSPDDKVIKHLHH